MAKPALKIKKLEVNRVDLTKGYLSLLLEFAVNDSSERIEKEFALDENAINFSIQYIREIKEIASKQIMQRSDHLILCWKKDALK